MKFLIALLLVSSAAWAQQTEFVPPQSGANDTCTARAYNPAQLDSCRFIHTIITKDNVRPLAWNNLLVLDNNADSGESTGQYIKANQWGMGATWAQVLQIQCQSPHAFQCFGDEIDLQPPTSGETRGYGIAMYVIRSNLVPIPPDSIGHAAAAYSVSGEAGGRTDVEVGFDAQIHCTVACFRMPGGEVMAYELSGRVVQKFDPQTGYAGWWRTDLNECIVCWNMSNGNEKHMWTP